MRIAPWLPLIDMATNGESYQDVVVLTKRVSIRLLQRLRVTINCQSARRQATCRPNRT